MKNMHVLPTEKPSRLLKNNKSKELFLVSKIFVQKNDINTNQHIYITSDEQPKHNDYYTTDGKEIYYCNTLNPTRNNHYKKIILTTDQDLIKDGVQAIDDEFLEWFVKNPSCEEVEVEKWTDYKLENYKDVPFFKYKIIIPKTTQQIIDEDFAGGLNMGQILPKQEINYSKEEVIKFAKWCAELKVWDNETYVNNTFEELLQQFKNK
jgi:hypothetical protein